MRCNRRARTKARRGGHEGAGARPGPQAGGVPAGTASLPGSAEAAAKAEDQGGCGASGRAAIQAAALFSPHRLPSHPPGKRQGGAVNTAVEAGGRAHVQRPLGRSHLRTRRAGAHSWAGPRKPCRSEPTSHVSRPALVGWGEGSGRPRAPTLPGGLCPLPGTDGPGHLLPSQEVSLPPVHRQRSQGTPPGSLRGGGRAWALEPDPEVLLHIRDPAHV